RPRHRYDARRGGTQEDAMSRRATIRSALAGAFVLALLAAGCSSSASKSGSSAPPTTARPTPTTGLPDAQPIASGQGRVLVGTATGDSPCEKAAPTPASPGEVGTGGGGASKADVIAGEHGARGMVKQLPLTHQQRIELQQQMEQARAAAAEYPTVTSA